MSQSCISNFMLLKIPLLLFSQQWRIDSDSFAPLLSSYLDSIIPSSHCPCLVPFGYNSQKFLLGRGLQPRKSLQLVVLRMHRTQTTECSSTVRPGGILVLSINQGLVSPLWCSWAFQSFPGRPDDSLGSLVLQSS